MEVKGTTLEKARGETAALPQPGQRGALVEGSPALIQLRTLQAVAAQPGSTIVLGAPRIVAEPAPRSRRSKDENE